MNLEKIRFITDSACDIPTEEERKLPNLQILPIPITVDAKGYFERESFTFDEYYDILEKAEGIPATSHITTHTFLEKYQQAYQDGCTHIIHVTLYSGASNMFEAAQQARDMFFEEQPEAQIKIEIIDSQCYTMGYGYPLIVACKMAEVGIPFEEIIAYIKEYLNRVEIYFSPFTLKFVKKSGRVSCAAAFVGELLGLRPVISAIGTTSIVEKVRGNAAVVSYISKLFAERRDQSKPNQPYMILIARSNQSAEELASACEKIAGYPPKGVYKIGAAIATNTGPDIVGITFLGAQR